LISQLEVASYRAQLADAPARTPQLQQLAHQLTNALSALLGQPPGLTEELTGEASPPRRTDVIAIGLPTDAARRRSDIRSAEARLHAATAQIGVAIADLYPRITLTGGFLQEALQGADLREWGAHQCQACHCPFLTVGGVAPRWSCANCSSRRRR
jgi:outer membrane protein TolC